MRSMLGPTSARLRRFRGTVLRPAIVVDTAPLEVTAWPVPDEPVPFVEATKHEFAPFAVGDPWGPAWGTVWFRMAGRVPAAWDAAAHRIEAVVDLSFDPDHPGFQAEGTAYTPAGTIIKGVHPRNQYVPLTPDAEGAVAFYVEAAANPEISTSTSDHTWLGDKLTAGPEPLYRLAAAHIALVNVPAWELDQDLTVLADLIQELPAGSTRSARIANAVDAMLDAIDPDDLSGTLEAGRAALAPALEQGAVPSAHTVHAVGHAHIDSAWLWPTRETMRKCARTFANAISLMDTQPDFSFACSSAQQYQWVKDTQPELFERIKQKVAEGRFIPVGGMWVESDTNMVGGEAMARQFLEGKAFFRDEFGVEPTEVWLPDSFGYTGAMPQIMRQAGADWFLTQKMSWNDTNTMPHHTFLWRGIDGTGILTHFPPVDTYNSDLSQRDLAHAESEFQDKGTSTRSLAPFGWGDGGGGPTREMIAAGRRAADLEGSPKVVFTTPTEFAEAVRAETPEDSLPVWQGEMYLELHRGTYTSQARTKSGNRRCEHLLREAELWCAHAAINTGFTYPYEELRAAWRIVLLQQFHDILPGSSIAWVYRVAEENYAQVAQSLESLIDGALTALAAGGSTPTAFNAAPVPAAATDGAAPALGSGPAAVAPSPVVVRETNGVWQLDNELVHVEIDHDGRIVSLREVGGREAVAPGGAIGRLTMLRDRPADWDGWDVDRADRTLQIELPAADSCEVVTESDLAGVRATYKLGASTIVWTAWLRPGAQSVEIELDIDWHEKHKLLRLESELDVLATHHRAETQFGHVVRPLSTNTSWDVARFECCQHRWVHVGEPGFGVAIANDSTYGYAATSSVRPDGGTTTNLAMSVLRAPTYPDPEADQGAHHMRYAVRPGASVADAVAEGYRINLPVRWVKAARPVAPLVAVDGAMVESVKLAQDRSGDVIVRLYESCGTATDVVLRAGFDVAGAATTDLLEREWLRPGADTSVLRPETDGTYRLRLRPFEIVTVRLSRI